MLRKIQMFKTPENILEVQDFIEALPSKECKAAATIVMGMTWNLCAELIAEELGYGQTD